MVVGLRLGKAVFSESPVPLEDFAFSHLRS